MDEKIEIIIKTKILNCLKQKLKLDGNPENIKNSYLNLTCDLYSVFLKINKLIN